MIVEVKETRRREIYLTVTVPEAEWQVRRQPYTDRREYEVREVRAEMTEIGDEEGRLRITFFGPLVTKAGRSGKIRCDENFWKADDGLAACGPLTRAAIERRISAWRSDGAS